MKQKINIAELLKDCPKGMELYSPIFGNVKLEKVFNNFIYVFDSDELIATFDKKGKYKGIENGECQLFPSKDQRDWSKFQRPFEDGDIVAYDNPYGDNLQVFIFKDKKENNTLSSCYLMLDGDVLDLEEGTYYVTRLATEEEKQKLFDAIKANGYKWNSKTKTLEKLHKFKVGDRVRNKNYKDYICDIQDIIDKGYVAKEINANSPILILFGSQEYHYELAPNKFDVTTLKPFESRVLVRDTDTGAWKGAFYSHYKSNKFYTIGNISYYQCIPYEMNKHLLDTTNDCAEYYKTWE